MREPVQLPVTISQVPVHSTAPRHVIRVIRIREREAFEHAELGLDEIEPGGLGRRVDGVDAEAPEQRQEAGMVVNVMEIVHDHEQSPAGIAGTQPAKGVAHVGDSLAAPKDPTEAVGMDIIEAQELLRAVLAMIGRAHAVGLAPAGPRPPAHRADFQRPPFVEADHGRPRRAPVVELANAFFYDQSPDPTRSSTSAPAGPSVLRVEAIGVPIRP